jgi:NADPH-dependent curcumin reductase CurA
MMQEDTYTRIVLAERPTDSIVQGKTFRTERTPLSSFTPVRAGHVRVHVTWVSLDPAMRGWLNDTRSYVPPVQIGEVMRAGGIGVVVEAAVGCGLAVGDVVSGMLGKLSYSSECF